MRSIGPRDRRNVMHRRSAIIVVAALVVFETEDEYFDYYRDYHAFWKMYGMRLPDSVLQNVY
jgi:hypothetical protein